MSTVGRDLASVELTARELWQGGPPHELFARMHAVSRDWQSYSSERGGVLAALGGLPLELAQAMFIGMDPPKHDRLKALFQAGFTPTRIAAHEDAIRAIVRDVLERLEGREGCE